MKDLKLKICGMRDPDNIREVARLAPDYMGFIFYEKTPRFTGEDFFIPDDFPESITRVGVFVNQPTAHILSTVRLHGLHLVQLHGDESPAQCAEIMEQGTGVIKVFSVDDNTDFTVTDQYRSVAEYFLFDTKGKWYGGNAQVFDWSILSRYNQKVPFFLSGGISPENAEGIRALDDLNVVAVDVNSGVETRPAFKDVSKISALRAILNSKSLLSGET